MGRLIRRVPLDFATAHPIGDVWPGYLLPYGQRHDPPTGDGWQIWETTTEGSPISAVCATPEELADWAADNHVSIFGEDTMEADEWLNFIQANEAAWPSQGTAMAAAMGVETYVRDLRFEPQNGDTKRWTDNDGAHVAEVFGVEDVGEGLDAVYVIIDNAHRDCWGMAKWCREPAVWVPGLTVEAAPPAPPPIAAPPPSPADRIAAAYETIAAAQAEIAADTTRTAEDAQLRPVPGDVRDDGDQWTCVRSTEWAVEFRDGHGRLNAWPLGWWSAGSGAFIPAHLAKGSAE